MLHQGRLKVPIIRLHPLCSSSPWRNGPFRERLRLVRDHQFRIANQLGPETMTGGTCTEMTIEGKMLWSQFTEGESALRVPVVRAVTCLVPTFGSFATRCGC